MFKVIEMTKKGYGKVTLVQTEEPKYHYIVNGIDAELNGPDALNQVYKDLKAKGYTVKVVPENEPKKEAPETPKPEKPETRFIYCKESRKIWATEYDRRKREALQKIINLKGQEYHDARIKMEEELKKEMRAWESENAVEVNKMLRQRKAEADAIQQ